jgi:type II secretory pathway predicted ATPase ExeA
MYEAYWGLARSPFGSSAARQALIASPVHAEALARLDFLRESKSPLGLLVGPSGSGKSVVLTEFAQRAKRSGTLVGLVSTAAAEEAHVLPCLAESLHVALDGHAPTLWRRIVDRLAELRFDGLTVALLLDDLDRAAGSTLALAERLLAIPDSPLTIVATARPETITRLGRRLLECVALRIELSPWNEQESRDYLDRSLAAAGRMQPAYSDAAARRLFELSGGAPRRMNQLAQLALLAGAGQRLAIVESETIDAVQDELSFA